MNKLIFIVGVALICFSIRNYVKTQWVYHTGVQVYNEQDLYNAVDNVNLQPWWKSKSIVIRARHLFLDRDVVLPPTVYFSKEFRSVSGKGASETSV